MCAKIIISAEIAKQSREKMALMCVNPPDLPIVSNTGLLVKRLRDCQ